MLSLLLCGTGVSSQYLSDEGVFVPTCQNFLNYVFLMVTLVPIQVLRFQFKLSSNSDQFSKIYKGKFRESLRERWWHYMFLALVDVEANFLIVKAYQYTNFTSIQVQIVECCFVRLISYVSLILRFWIALRFPQSLCLEGSS